MILSDLLVCFFATETMANVKNHKAALNLNINIQGFYQ